MKNIREEIFDLISKVEAFDEFEKNHKQDILDWLSSGVEIFRIERPAVPLKHLVCYSVLVDVERRKILLFDHTKALLLLPGGGHVDRNEMPFATSKRELLEELNIQPKPLVDSSVPFFVTVTETVGNTPGHIDVDLWYLFEGDSALPITSETEDFKREFSGYQWMTFDEILSTPIEKLDVNMHRFVEKLITYLK